MKISKKGLDLIKRFEGLSLKPYLCPAGKPTIGYGCTFYADGTKVSLDDDSITELEANKLLEDIANNFFSITVNRYVKVPLTQNQFDALVSFTYNVGNRNFRRSTLLKKLNRWDFIGASNEFWKWRRSGGKILRGLIIRRRLEKDLFLEVSLLL